MDSSRVRRMLRAERALREEINGLIRTESVYLDIDDDLCAQLFAICAERNITPAELIEDAVGALKDDLDYGYEEDDGCST